MFRGISFRLVAKLASRAPRTDLYKKFPTSAIFQPRTLQYPASWYTLARFSTDSSHSTNERVISQTTLEEYNRLVDKESWYNVLSMLEHLGSVPVEILDHKLVSEFYQKVENRFMNKERYIVQSKDLIEIGYLFGGQSLGSEAFWQKLMDKFYFLASNRRLTFEQSARFLSAASNVLCLDSDVWTLLEESLIRNPIIITPNLIGYMLPLLVRTYSKQSGEAAVNLNQYGGIKIPDLEDNQLWLIFKDAALKEASNMNKGELGVTCWSFGLVKYQEEGFWMLAEQRFNDFKSELENYEYAQYALTFGTARQGSPDFWQEMEGHVLNNINNLTGLEVRQFINGFATAEEGTLRLWNELQKCIVNVELSPSDLSFIIQGLGIYEITNPRTWDYLEEQTITKMDQFGSFELIKIIPGFTRAQRGEQKLWDAIEDRILNSHNLSDSEKLTYYITLKSSERLTSNLASHLKDVAEAGDYLCEQGEGQDQDQDQDQNQSQSQSRDQML